MLIDAGHYNVFTTTTRRLDPFVDLMKSDGFRVDTHHGPFTATALAGNDVLVIMTAMGYPRQGSDSAGRPAFTRHEIEAIHAWVESGGALLVALDHFPFNSAGRSLVERFGTRVSPGMIEDTIHSEAGQDSGPDDRYGTLVYSRANNLLGDHPIIRGRTQGEEIRKVAVFGGSSISPPAGGATLLRLSSTAVNVGDAGRLPVGLETAQGVAFTVGTGRVVITADGSMWTAQLVPLRGARVPYGMARTDLDNRQLALNVMRWLAGSIQHD